MPRNAHRKPVPDEPQVGWHGFFACPRLFRPDSTPPGSSVLTPGTPLLTFTITTQLPWLVPLLWPTCSASRPSPPSFITRSVKPTFSTRTPPNCSPRVSPSTLTPSV